jgi:hypothetical protein
MLVAIQQRNESLDRSASSLSWESFKEVYMSKPDVRKESDIGDEGVEHIASCLAASQLEELSLHVRATQVLHQQLLTNLPRIA